jgi:4-amino-4-deoxy-L-arabinose transferase-like glycosyltransferase
MLLIQRSRKLFENHLEEICAFAIIGVAALLRLFLISQGWPQTDSDESTMGLMALHIMQKGEHPTFFYGQDYMGSLEAYIAAAMFHLFGPSTFSLRLGLIFLFVLFLVSMYYLASLLYTKKFALATLILLSLGSDTLLQRELDAIGGYPETILFGTLAFLLASWLALSFHQDLSQQNRRLRFAAYGFWGLVVGLGIWSDLLILPFVFMAGLILIVFCWREWRTWAPLFIVLGFVIGALPFILYNISANPGWDTFSVVSRIGHQGADALTSLRSPIIAQLTGAFLVGLPTATGITPACMNIGNVQFTGVSSPQHFLCSTRYLSWATCFTLLWLIAVVLAVIAIWRRRRQFLAHEGTSGERQTLIRQFARLTLLGSAALAFALFVQSPAPAVWPFTSSRYLFGLLIATPAIIRPLWNGTSTLRRLSPGLMRVLVVFKGAILLLIGAIFLMGTLNTFSIIPATQAIDWQQEVLVNDLLAHGITRMYSDYWTCDRVIFQSDERIICGVIGGQLQRGYNRYGAYFQIVKADPRSAYVLLVGSSEASTFAHKGAPMPGQYYRHFTLDGYEIYQPV